MFGELELAKLQQFMEKVDIEGIRKRILQSWQSKKRVNKQLKHFTEQGESKQLKLWRQVVDNTGTKNEEIKSEDYRIKVLNKIVSFVVVDKWGEYVGSMRKTDATQGNLATTTEDLETEGRDTVSDYPTVEAFNQLRVKTFISNKKGIDSQGTESSYSGTGTKSPFAARHQS